MITTDFDKYTCVLHDAIQGAGCSPQIAVEISELAGSLAEQSRSSCREGDGERASAIFMAAFSVACNTAKELSELSGGKHPDVIVRFLSAFPHPVEMRREFPSLMVSVNG